MAKLCAEPSVIMSCCTAALFRFKYLAIRSGTGFAVEQQFKRINDLGLTGKRLGVTDYPT